MIKIAPTGPVCKVMDAYHGDSDASFIQYLGADDVAGCFHKSSEGLSVVDTKLKTRWPLMRATKKVIGVYHYYHPNIDPKKQAAAFYAACKGLLQAGDMIWMDWETTDNVPTQSDRENGLVFLQECDRLFGIKCGIYSGPYFLQALALDARFANRVLWVAHYTTGGPLVPSPFKSWQFWQYQGSGMDMSYFNGNIAALRKFAGKV